MNAPTVWKPFKPRVTRNGKTTKCSVWYVGFTDPVTGKPRRISTGQKHLRNAETFASELQRKLLLGQLDLVDKTVEHRRRTWESVYTEYLEANKSRLENETNGINKRACKK